MKQLETCPPVQAAEYVPVAGDFAQLEQADIATDTNYASQGYWKGVATHFVRNKRAMIGLILVLLMIFLAFVAPLFSGYAYDEIVTALNAKGHKKAAVGISPRVPAIHEMVTGEPYDDIYADKTFLFGTDDLGRDLWTRTWYGARVSLMIAFVTIIIDMLIGMSYGLLSGYFGGRVDSIMQRFVEIANSIPRLVIVSVLAIFMPKGIGLVIVTLLLTEWIGMSKIARAEMLKMKEQEYVSRQPQGGDFLPSGSSVHQEPAVRHPPPQSRGGKAAYLHHLRLRHQRHRLRQGHGACRGWHAHRPGHG